MKTTAEIILNAPWPNENYLFACVVSTGEGFGIIYSDTAPEYHDTFGLWLFPETTACRVQCSQTKDWDKTIITYAQWVAARVPAAAPALVPEVGQVWSTSGGLVEIVYATENRYCGKSLDGGGLNIYGIEELKATGAVLRDKLMQHIGDCSSSKDTCRDIADAILSGALDGVLKELGYTRN
jgi:hypothetical protein